MYCVLSGISSVWVCVFTTMLKFWLVFVFLNMWLLLHLHSNRSVQWFVLVWIGLSVSGWFLDLADQAHRIRLSYVPPGGELPSLHFADWTLLSVLTIFNDYSFLWIKYFLMVPQVRCTNVQFLMNFSAPYRTLLWGKCRGMLCIAANRWHLLNSSCCCTLIVQRY